MQYRKLIELTAHCTSVQRRLIKSRLLKEAVWPGGAPVVAEAPAEPCARIASSEAEKPGVSDSIK